MDRIIFKSFNIILVMIMISIAATGCNNRNKGRDDAVEADVTLKPTQQNEAASPTPSPDPISNLERTGSIHINQIGYRPNDKKMFIYTGEKSLFSVVDLSNGSTALTGETDEAVFDDASGEEVCKGDFSSVEDDGDYVIVIDNKHSYPFKIESGVYNELDCALLKMLYFQRANEDLDGEYAGAWARKGSIKTNGIVYGQEDRILDGEGGWFDAGDYGKYVVPGVKAVQDLLLTYQFFPEKTSIDINIPESGNGIPDILDEARVELDWLLKMQDEESGGVFHKMTTQGFSPMSTKPNQIFAEYYFAPISSTATGCFAAIMASASRVYKEIDPDFAVKCLESSETAWNWLNDNLDYPMFTNPPGVNTGDYSDSSDADERYWAAVELYRATGEEQYHSYVKSSYQQFLNNSLYWTDTIETYNVSLYGTISYLTMPKENQDKKLGETLLSDFNNTAVKIQKRSASDGYMVALEPDQYFWGSNMNVMHTAMHLIISDYLSPNEKFIHAAHFQLDYLLGQNSLSQSYVTGFGAKSPKNPHHRPSLTDPEPEPVPGMVIGGPNLRFEDPKAKSVLQGMPPAKCYIDHMSSYSTNEITIYWNSAAVFVATYFSE